MRLAILLVTLTTIAAVLYTSAQPAHSCSCPSVTFPDRVRFADLVVVGEIVEPTDYGAIVSVERYFKQSGPGTIAVYDPSFEAGCWSLGTVAEPGDRYQLYLSSFGYGLDYPYTTGHCDGNTELEPGQPDDDHLLGLERYGGPSLQPQRTNTPTELMWLTAAAVPLAFLAVATLAPWRRR